MSSVKNNKTLLDDPLLTFCWITLILAICAAIISNISTANNLSTMYFPPKIKQVELKQIIESKPCITLKDFGCIPYKTCMPTAGGWQYIRRRS